MQVTRKSIKKAFFTGTTTPVSYIGWDVGHMLGHMLGHVIITGTICDHHRHYILHMHALHVTYARLIWTFDWACDHHRHYMLHMHALYVTYARLIWTFDWTCDHHRHYMLHMHALYAWFSNEQKTNNRGVFVCLYAVGRFEIATCTPCMCALCVSMFFVPATK